MNQSGRPMPGLPGYRPMMGPAVLAAVPYITAALAVAGTAMTVKGQIDQQSAMGAQQAYLAEQARQRQQAAEWQAADAKQRGEISVDKQRALTAQRIGSQQASLLGQGTTLEGSPTDILGDTARAGEQDALTLRSNAAREAWGYQVQGAGFGADAAMRDTFQPSYLGAGSSLLMGASSLADKWNKYRMTDPSGGGSSSYGAIGNKGGSYGGFSGSGDY